MVKLQPHTGAIASSISFFISFIMHESIPTAIMPPPGEPPEFDLSKKYMSNSPKCGQKLRQNPHSTGKSHCQMPMSAFYVSDI